MPHDLDFLMSGRIARADMCETTKLDATSLKQKRKKREKNKQKTRRKKKKEGKKTKNAGDIENEQAMP